MKRTWRMILTLCLLLLFSGQAMAEHSGPYVAAFIGGSALMAAKSTDSLGDFNLTFKPDLLGSAVLGWDFVPGDPVGPGRIELEYTRRRSPLDQVKFVEGSFTGGGDVTAESLLLNFFGVFRNKGPMAPYFGVGVGAARMGASALTVTNEPLATGSDIVFAYQVGTGVEFALTNYLSLDLGYRFFSGTRPKFTEANGKNFKMDYLSHSAMLGLRLGF